MGDRVAGAHEFFEHGHVVRFMQADCCCCEIFECHCDEPRHAWTGSPTDALDQMGEEFLGDFGVTGGVAILLPVRKLELPARTRYRGRVAKPNFIDLPGVTPIPILYEDRSVMAIDKPRGWMLVPHSWQKTNWNLQAAIVSSISAGDFWARSRNLKFLKFVHRLDAETTGILLFAKSQGAVDSISDLFETRKMEKTYLAVVAGSPPQDEWTCRLQLGPAPGQIGRMVVDEQLGKEAETHFRVLHRRERLTLVEAHPLTGRTHQIRIHLAESGFPCVGDDTYGRGRDGFKLGLRAARLAYPDPFTRRRVEISAPCEEFCREYGFDISKI